MMTMTMRWGARSLAGGLVLLGAVLLAGCREGTGEITDDNPSPATKATGALDQSADEEPAPGTCVHRPFTMNVSAPPAAPLAAGSTAHYTVSVTDQDTGDCAGALYTLSLAQEDLSVTTHAEPSLFFDVMPGATITFGVDVTALPSADPGAHELDLEVAKLGSGPSERQAAQVVYTIAPPAGCFVSKRAELMILSTKVVDDPVRTRGNLDHFPTSSCGPRAGAFSFAQLVRALAPSEAQAPALVERLLSLWLADQSVNGFVVRARPAMRERLLDRWPRTPSGELDLERAPLRLQAIVNRVDLRDLDRHSAGEGRFVFAFDVPHFFTLILEYDLPAETQEDVLGWAKAWHALSRHEYGGAAYRAALEKVTHRFTRRGASPARPNGSALFRIRTNENELPGTADGSSWEMRQFELSAVDGFFAEAPVSEPPDLGFNGSATFVDFANQNAAAIAAAVPGSSTGIVPRTLDGRPFLAGSAINPIPNGVAWFGSGLSGMTRFRASLMTCNGCHGFDTQSIFLQITPRAPGREASLSSFIRGVTVNEPGAGPIALDDLGRRQADLRALVCPPGTP